MRVCSSLARSDPALGELRAGPHTGRNLPGQSLGGIREGSGLAVGDRMFRPEAMHGFLPPELRGSERGCWLAVTQVGRGRIDGWSQWGAELPLCIKQALIAGGVQHGAGRPAVK